MELIFEEIFLGSSSPLTAVDRSPEISVRFGVRYLSELSRSVMFFEFMSLNFEKLKIPNDSLNTKYLKFGILDKFQFKIPKKKSSDSILRDFYKEFMEFIYFLQ